MSVNNVSGSGPLINPFLPQTGGNEGVTRTGLGTAGQSMLPSDMPLSGQSNAPSGAQNSPAQTLTNLENALSALDGFLKGASNKDLLFAALVELASQQRQSAVDARSAARNEAKGQLMNAADKTFEAADKQRSAAVAALVTGLVSATVSIGMGLMSLGTMAKGGFGKTAGVLKQNAHAAMARPKPTVTQQPTVNTTTQTGTTPTVGSTQTPQTQTPTTTTQPGQTAPQTTATTNTTQSTSSQQNTQGLKTDGPDTTTPQQGTKSTDDVATPNDVGKQSNTSTVEELAAKANAIGKHTDYVNSQIQIINSLMGGLKSATEATGGFASKLLEADATTLQARGQQQQALAQDTQQEQDTQKKLAEDMSQVLEQARQFIKAMMDAEVERGAIANKA